MSKEAKKVRAEYMRKYREENKERIAIYNADWRSKPENKEKIRKNQADYWERLALRKQEEA